MANAQYILLNAILATIFQTIQSAQIAIFPFNTQFSSLLSFVIFKQQCLCTTQTYPEVKRISCIKMNAENLILP